MSIFVIGDLHLSTNHTTNKSMEKFGRRWLGYTEKLRRNCRSEGRGFHLGKGSGPLSHRFLGKR